MVTGEESNEEREGKVFVREVLSGLLRNGVNPGFKAGLSYKWIKSLSFPSGRGIGIQFLLNKKQLSKLILEFKIGEPNKSCTYNRVVYFCLNNKFAENNVEISEKNDSLVMSLRNINSIR